MPERAEKRGNVTVTRGRIHELFYVSLSLHLHHTLPTLYSHPPSSPATMASADATSSAMQGERSPIAKLLESLGMTREDLSRHSAQMREFLLTENPALRALGQSSDKFASTSTFPNSTNGDRSESTRSSSEIRSQSVASTRFSHPPKTPPPTHSRHTHYQRHTSKQPVHTNGHDGERVAEKRTPRRRKEKARRQSHSATSPSRPKPSLDMIMQMQSRNSRRVYESEESEESDDASMDVRNACS